MSIIQAKDLVHEYFRRDDEGNIEGIDIALNHIDLDVSEGQFIAILGHNGSGKSTLAKHINALLRPSSGTLYVDGKDVSDVSMEYEIRQNAGYKPLKQVRFRKINKAACPLCSSFLLLYNSLFW